MTSQPDTSEPLAEEQRARLDCLRERLRRMESALIAFSGGVDSTLLASVAHQVLGPKAVAVTATSETYPQFEREQALALARQIGIRHMIMDTSELEIEGFQNNPPDRCYFCKKELFTRLRKLADNLGLAALVDGANRDDAGDYRPGMRAAEEIGVCSPLKDCGFSKEDIRAVSRHFGLPTWDQPSYACLASRFPYGQPITAEALRRVAEAEEFLRQLGFRQLRVRHYGETARIELAPQDISRAADPQTRPLIVANLKQLGYTYVALDLQGYRTGSMNETLSTSGQAQRTRP